MSTMPKKSPASRNARHALSSPTPRRGKAVLLRRVPWSIWLIAGGVAFVFLPPPLRRSLVAGVATLALSSVKQRIRWPGHADADA